MRFVDKALYSFPNYMSPSALAVGTFERSINVYTFYVLSTSTGMFSDGVRMSTSTYLFLVHEYKMLQMFQT